MPDGTQSSSLPAPARPGPVAALGRTLLELLQILGEVGTLLGATVWHCRSFVRHREKILYQLVIIGTETLGIAS
ncbi:MAG: hypothetical protein ACREQY_12060, partial [Candidatus Binatia bacterium]